MTPTLPLLAMLFGGRASATMTVSCTVVCPYGTAADGHCLPAPKMPTIKGEAVGIMPDGTRVIFRSEAPLTAGPPAPERALTPDPSCFDATSLWIQHDDGTWTELVGQAACERIAYLEAQG